MRSQLQGSAKTGAATGRAFAQSCPLSIIPKKWGPVFGKEHAQKERADWGTAMLKVWGRRSSFNVQKVMWLIGELGLAHDRIDAGSSFGGLDTPEFLAMNPHGRIPVIA